MAQGVLLVAISPNLRAAKPAELSVAALITATSLDVYPGGTSKRQGRHRELRHKRSAQQLPVKHRHRRRSPESKRQSAAQCPCQARKRRVWAVRSPRGAQGRRDQNQHQTAQHSTPLLVLRLPLKNHSFFILNQKINTKKTSTPRNTPGRTYQTCGRCAPVPLLYKSILYDMVI